MTRAIIVAPLVLLLCGCQQSSGSGNRSVVTDDAVKRFLDVGEAVANDPAFVLPAEDSQPDEAGEGAEGPFDFLRPLRSQSIAWTDEQRDALSKEAASAGFKDVNEWVETGDAALCALTVRAKDLSLEKLEQDIAELEKPADSAAADPAVAAENQQRLASYREELAFCKDAVQRLGDSVDEHAARIREFFGVDAGAESPPEAATKTSQESQ
jgi:hypothetical protein